MTDWTPDCSKSYKKKNSKSSMITWRRTLINEKKINYLKRYLNNEMNSLKLNILSHFK
jgi:hypothetical protein